MTREFYIQDYIYMTLPLIYKSTYINWLYIWGYLFIPAWNVQIAQVSAIHLGWATKAIQAANEEIHSSG